MVPHLNERLIDGSEEECMAMADLVCLLLQQIMNLVSLIKASKGYI
jgi:hypothetical protein